MMHAELRSDGRQPVVYVSDLSLTLHRGKVYQVTKDIADASSDLWHLHRKGFISIRWIERDTAMKRKPSSFAPPFVALSRKGKKVNRMSENSEDDRDPQTSEGVDIESIIARVRNETANQMATQVAQIKSSLVEELRALLSAAQTPEEPSLPANLGEVIASAVQQSLGNLSISSGNVSLQEDDTPVFIPSKILNPEEGVGSVEIEVQSSSSGSGSVEDAAEALKALKRKKKK
jgi:hypothetical protein